MAPRELAETNSCVCLSLIRVCVSVVGAITVATAECVAERGMIQFDADVTLLGPSLRYY